MCQLRKGSKILPNVCINRNSVSLKSLVKIASIHKYLFVMPYLVTMWECVLKSGLLNFTFQPNVKVIRRRKQDRLNLSCPFRRTNQVNQVRLQIK